MKMTVNEAINSHQCLQQFGSNKIPFMVSLKIGRNQRAIAEVVTEFEKRRGELLKTYGEVGDEGNTKIPKEKQEKFNEEMRKLVDEEVEVEVTTISENSMPAKFEAESNSLMFLDWMFTTDDKPKARRKK